MKRIIILVLLFVIISCNKDNNSIHGTDPNPPGIERDDISQYNAKEWDGIKRGGVFYEIFVRSFADSNGDGIGDLNGITAKLDYLNQIGISGIWLTPIHPSPSYHGYDVEDYLSVKPEYGTMNDFEELVKKAKSLNIKIILDLVLNHTSKTHPWFIDAISSQESRYRDYYLISPSDLVSSNISSGKIPMTQSYISSQWHNISQGTSGYNYLGMFSDWMPDLNFGSIDTCEVSAPFKEMVEISKFWIAKGVSGFRLDAVKHIYQNEISEENPLFLKKFFDSIKKERNDIYVVGENLSGDYREVSPYYTGLPALFNFDAWYKLIYAIENSHAKWYPKDIVEMEASFRSYRNDAINVTKLSNHDEDRTLSRLGGDISKAKIAAAILLTISGSPYIYYGEEIGMLGMKNGGDENVREPFLWSSIQSDNYRTKWRNPLFSTESSVRPLELQRNDKNSIFRVYEKFLKLRNTYQSLAYGEMRYPSNLDSYDKNFMVFFREYSGEKLMIIHNVSSNTSTIAISDPIVRAVADMGSVTYSKINTQSHSVTMPPYSTIIFEL
ncbi:alpha-amylase family glycosyl hydrolase [Bacteroidales bacterium MB20-C3-3]|nr:alpha-amylase family glycosyl hydrolase [Bacteroidales bacterium MB20-C3-3]